MFIACPHALLRTSELSEMLSISLNSEVQGMIGVFLVYKTCAYGTLLRHIPSDGFHETLLEQLLGPSAVPRRLCPQPISNRLRRPVLHAEVKAGRVLKAPFR